MENTKTTFESTNTKEVLPATEAPSLTLSKATADLIETLSGEKSAKVARLEALKKSGSDTTQIAEEIKALSEKIKDLRVLYHLSIIPAEVTSSTFFKRTSPIYSLGQYFRYSPAVALKNLPEVVSTDIANAKNALAIAQSIITALEKSELYRDTFDLAKQYETNSATVNFKDFGQKVNAFISENNALFADFPLALSIREIKAMSLNMLENRASHKKNVVNAVPFSNFATALQNAITAKVNAIELKMGDFTDPLKA